MKNTIISLYDFTGEAVKPWAFVGFNCVCFDNQHSRIKPNVVKHGFGTISFIHADLYDRAVLSEIVKEYLNEVFLLMAFPVCTDMAVSGSKHFESKRADDPLFQVHATDHVRMCETIGKAFKCPYIIENPRSVLSTFYRKPDYSFEPFEFGDYIPDDEAEHPVWPEYIAAKDAYPKTTYLWTGGNWTMPEKKPVFVPEGYSDQFKKLGGKSMKTKNIRSATPRGFAIANFLANSAYGLMK
jgi:hypothetical protein